MSLQKAWKWYVFVKEALVGFASPKWQQALWDWMHNFFSCHVILWVHRFPQWKKQAKNCTTFSVWLIPQQYRGTEDPARPKKKKVTYQCLVWNWCFQFFWLVHMQFSLLSYLSRYQILSTSSVSLAQNGITVSHEFDLQLIYTKDFSSAFRQMAKLFMLHLYPQTL